MGEHTPGKWKLREHPLGELTDIYVDGIPDTLATTGFHGWRPETRQANARLIAAAPDLLTACEAALDRLVSEVADCSCERVWTDDDYILQCTQCDLRAAISKARGGETHGRPEAET